MSVSYVATWPDGQEEEVYLGTLRSLEQGWAPLAERLGLQYIPRFYSWCPVYPVMIDELLAELAVFRPAVITTYPEAAPQVVERIDDLMAALRRLQQSDGWEADIG